jgi:phosphocarrier protein HPr
MTKREIIIKNKTGLHARPAAVVVQNANKFTSDIFLEKDDDRVNAKSIMGVMMLAAGEGSSISIVAEGADEREAVDRIAELLQSDIDSGVSA